MARIQTLDDNEKAMWARVIASVTPMHAAKPVASKPAISPALPIKSAATAKAATPAKPVILVKQATPKAARVNPAPPKPAALNNLDGSWDRRIGKGAVIPDVSVDLHGSGLSSAYARLDGALEQAIAQNMRVILLVTGKVRAHDRATGQGRGAIASVVRDWLSASRHASRISAVRGAHPRHGGTGALYIILKR